MFGIHTLEGAIVFAIVVIVVIYGLSFLLGLVKP